MIFLLALALSVVCHWLALSLFPRLGLLDYPERYGLQRRRLPYPFGLVSVLLFLGFWLALQPYSLQNLGILVAVMLLALVSFVDDRSQLPASFRLAVQVLAAVVVFATGTRIYSLTNPLAGWTGFNVIQLDTLALTWPALSNPSIVGALFTILWLGLTTNALNWFDGIPGQVSTLSAISFATIGFLSLSGRVQQPELAVLSFVLAAIALGGLFFNFPPAKAILGDTGAMFYGFMIGILTIYAGGKVATAFLVLGVPLIDVVLVILQRLWKRQRLSQGDTKNQHLHHRLLSKGWSPQSIILLTAGIGTAFGVTALFLTTSQKFMAALVLFAVMVGLFWYSRK